VADVAEALKESEEQVDLICLDSVPHKIVLAALDVKPTPVEDDYIDRDHVPGRLFGLPRGASGGFGMALMMACCSPRTWASWAARREGPELWLYLAPLVGLVA